MNTRKPESRRNRIATIVQASKQTLKSAHEVAGEIDRLFIAANRQLRNRTKP